MTGVFETQTLRVCPTEPIICVKEFAKYSFCSPKFLTGTFLNANIKLNSVPNLLGGVQLNKMEDEDGNSNFNKRTKN